MASPPTRSRAAAKPAKTPAKARSAPRSGRPWLRYTLLGLMSLASLVLLIQLWFLFRVVWVSSQPPAQTSVMRQALADLRVDNPEATLDYRWVPYDRIANTLKQAVIAAEDANFVDHGGVEWDAVKGAWEHNRQLAERRQQAEEDGRRPPRQSMRGGSTITQQLAKNLFLSNSRSYLRKGQELVITGMIEHAMDKQRILELYLNVAEWGEGVFGAEAAAQHYYRVPASRLTSTQAARLAAMLPNPRFYDRNRNTPYLNARTNTLAARMRSARLP
jgi:monofunctional biosynthetic peptidoglycan transglycosylase